MFDVLHMGIVTLKYPCQVPKEKVQICLPSLGVFSYWLILGQYPVYVPGLENSNRPLVFTSVSGYRARDHFDISTENNFSHICQYFL